MSKFLDYVGAERFVSKIKSIFLEKANLTMALDEDVSKPVYFLSVNGSSASLVNSDGNIVSFISIATYFRSGLGKIYVYSSNGASSLETMNAVLFNITRIDVPTASVVLSSVGTSGAMHIASLQDTGSGLTGTFSMVGIPTGSDEIVYDGNISVEAAIGTLYSDSYKIRDDEKSSSTIDLNSLTNPGTYNLLSTDTLTNSPLTYGLLKVYCGGTLINQEMYQQTANNPIFSRYSTDSGTTWSDWLRKAGFEYYVSWASGSHDANDPLPGTVFCRCGTGYTVNTPATSGYGYLVTSGRPSVVCHQTFTVYSTSGATGYYVRFYANNQWYPWVNIMGSGGASYTNGDEVSY